ncbi:hybrid sensor histidine kinase/response regulator [Xinfangfangia sp. CPCC 101601]|uniref:histidine kinase n=1 Tax=Pseudogemmobacter lacusdianii TaxID=3069608 RepID=A0ABU0VUF8_9RHOB|nr:hybrid sensor histidine kinase/response regulator [Xinfangfangia sp. CPCC 101601]MDQ2065367.1 hybrid sensor histidine kinase/response regulator [Xinfangfangia sp. CPCC 101601]
MIPSSPQVTETRSTKPALGLGQTAAGLRAWMPLLAAMLATDNRGTVALATTGEVLLANDAVGPLLVGLVQSFGSAAGWLEARDKAQRQGSCRVELRPGLAGTLSCVAPDGAKEQFFLLRPDENEIDEDNLSRSDRIAFMAHDLRAPLQALILASEAKTPSTAGQTTALSAVAKLALNQVQSLLETVQIDSLSHQSEPEESFDLVGLVRDMTQLLAPICQRSGSEIFAELPTGPQWHRGPAHLIRAILQNLICNAGRLEGGGPVTVRLRIAPSGLPFEQLITLEVEDQGPGLSPDERAALLAPRRRDSGSLAPSGTGFGLGLGIVTRAVRRLSGRIDVASGRNRRGSLFRVVFPLAQSSALPGPTAPERPVTLHGLRMLVAEDNPVNLSILVQSLTEAGAAVEGVADGKAALQRAKELRGKLNLVLLDINLPDIDGIEVTRRIRAMEAESRPSPAEPLLILGLTAHTGSVVHGAGLAAGMTQVLTKPIRPTQLHRALRDAWEGGIPETSLRPDEPEIAGTHSVLDERQVMEITEDMGRELAVSFMRRALAEATEVLRVCQEGAPADRLRSIIHSAIGSAGLTGLAAVTAALRDLQEPSREGLRDTAAEAAMQEALSKTESRLQAFAKEG